VASSEEEAIVRDTIRAFRGKEIEASWERLDRPDAVLFGSLWATLDELGVLALGLPDSDGGLGLGPQARFEVFSELGAGSPALALAVLLHSSALSLLHEPAAGLSAELIERIEGRRLTLVGPLLSTTPSAALELHSNGGRLLHGHQRIAQAHADFLLIAASTPDGPKLALVAADAEGLEFLPVPSSHGLRGLPFGALHAEAAAVEHVLPWPESGSVQRQADGLLAAILCGMMGEMAQRSAAYAIERYQGGKLIHEHDAVRQLIGPMWLAQRAARALALEVLQSEAGPADAVASTFAVEQARRSGLDSVQSFGGYGYMEDYRVERYLRDAHTIDNFWVQAARRQRELAERRFSEMLG